MGGRDHAAKDSCPLSRAGTCVRVRARACATSLAHLIDIEHLEECFERVIVLVVLIVLAPAKQVAPQLLTLNRAVAIYVNHIKELISLCVRRVAGVDPVDKIPDVLGDLAEEWREAHRDDDGGGEEVGQLRLDEPEVLGELEDDEGELAATRKEEGDADGLRTRQAECEGTEGEDESELRHAGSTQTAAHRRGSARACARWPEFEPQEHARAGLRSSHKSMRALAGV